MANKTLNFNTLKKTYLTVTLADEKKTTLMIGTPKKKVLDNLMILQGSLESIQDGDTSPEMIDDLYDACAKIMSGNKGGIEITSDYLSELFDIEDIVLFFTSYMEFVEAISNQKN